MSKSLQIDSAALDESMEAYLQILQLSIQASKQNAGGIAFKGNAIVPPEGIREEGTSQSLGPVTSFSQV